MDDEVKYFILLVVSVVGAITSASKALGYAHRLGLL